MAGEGITWWKGLYVRNAPNGSGWEIWTENARTSDSVALWAHEVRNGQDIEFRKAKFLGQYRYVLGDLDRLAPNVLALETYGLVKHRCSCIAHDP